MMWSEFEELSGIRVSYDTYSKVIEPMYMAVPNLSKQEFINTLNLKALAIPVKHEPIIKRMRVRNRMGETRTPNGCYCYIEYVEVVEVRIRDAKYVVAPLSDAELKKLYLSGHNLDLDTSFDMDYTQCIDKKTNKPVELTWGF